ncbi:DegT/DnrJ/EryC1/StrS family aminotransferase [Chromobacterium alticapitis]|uniref:Aminotransferase n=1 Tax=Chromobacterium alticapitis TaxID=2073169 RepID=A0A2S5DHY7_9NEIS|nr:DegT/DnrJ/EryC1/StrS family aminotransferase [Chromobacterium alticapitis]POZ62637.1 aminotransferase [Chromobacterium alticapitis]
MMSSPGSRLPVTQPFLPPLEEFLPYLEQIWSSKQLSNNGPFHRQLEARLADYLGVEYISLFANGTIALITALQALGIKGEVITSPYSFVATSHALMWNGIRPVFADIDPNSANIDPARIEALITERTTAILPVHVYGTPCDMDAIQRIADRHGLQVIYDAAHCFGVKQDGRSILLDGDLSILSFHATKVFNTFEGGAIVCHSAEMKQHIDHLKNFGFVDEITVVEAGINGKMSEIQSAMGLLQLQYIDEISIRRRRLYERYVAALSQVPGIALHPVANNVEWNYAYFPIYITAPYPLDRDGLYQAFRDVDVLARRYFYPLISDFAIYHSEPSALQPLPVAKRKAEQVLCLPIYPDLSDEQQDFIINLVRNPPRTKET